MNLYWISGILVAIVVFIYIYGILLAIINTFNDKPRKISSALHSIIKGISIMLSTNFGAVIGSNKLNLGEYNLLNAFTDGKTEFSDFQLIAFYMYFGILTTCLVIVAIKRFELDPKIIDPVIIEHFQYFIPICIAAFGLALGLSSM